MIVDGGGDGGAGRDFRRGGAGRDCCRGGREALGWGPPADWGPKAIA